VPPWHAIPLLQPSRSIFCSDRAGSVDYIAFSSLDLLPVPVDSHVGAVQAVCASRQLFPLPFGLWDEGSTCDMWHALPGPPRTGRSVKLRILRALFAAWAKKKKKKKKRRQNMRTPGPTPEFPMATRRVYVIRSRILLCCCTWRRGKALTPSDTRSLFSPDGTQAQFRFSPL